MTIKRPATGWRVQGVTTHPGAILREDFLKAMAISANHLALRTSMPATRVSQIVKERRSVSPDTALRLARYFGTSAEFWLNLQASHDLSKARVVLGDGIERDIKPLEHTANKIEASLRRHPAA